MCYVTNPCFSRLLLYSWEPFDVIHNGLKWPKKTYFTLHHWTIQIYLKISGRNRKKPMNYKWDIFLSFQPLCIVLSTSIATFLKEKSKSIWPFSRLLQGEGGSGEGLLAALNSKWILPKKSSAVEKKLECHRERENVPRETKRNLSLLL